MNCPKCRNQTEVFTNKSDIALYWCRKCDTTIVGEAVMAGNTDNRIAELEAACKLYRDASFQCHGGHWDNQMTGGQNCPECIRARKLRKEADELLEGK